MLVVFIGVLWRTGLPFCVKWNSINVASISTQFKCSDGYLNHGNTQNLILCSMPILQPRRYPVLLQTTSRVKPGLHLTTIMCSHSVQL